MPKNINFNGLSKKMDLHSIFILCLNFKKNQCCTNQSWSALVAVIDISCYLRPKSRESIFDRNNMVATYMAATKSDQDRPVDFLKIRIASSEVMQKKCTFFARPLNFLTKPLFWLCITEYKCQNVSRGKEVPRAS